VIFWALCLALVWCLFWGEFTLVTWLGGFVLALIILTSLGATKAKSDLRFVRKVLPMLGLLGFFLYELLLANLRVAFIVLSPRLKVRGAIVAVPVEVESDAEIVILASLITLTPGTLTLDVDRENKIFYIHAIHAEGREDVIREVKDGMERRVLAVTR
jgi:multicomponent Na+:H+ antiporter subunit E